MSARKFVKSIAWHTDGYLTAAPTADFILLSDLPAIAASDVGADAAGTAASAVAALSSVYQPLDGDLTALAALTGTNTIYYRSAANTWSAVTIGSGLTFSGGALSASGGSGTVSSVTVTTANGAQVSGGTTQTITGSGTFALTLPYTLSGTGSLANSGTSSLTGFTGSGSSSGTNTGDQTSVSGNAGTASALATGRTIGITGDITYTSPSFDGSGNVTAAATLAANIPRATTFTLTDAATITAPEVLALRHDTSGTAANNFGLQQNFYLQDSTTADQLAATIEVRWADATHATRKGYLVFRAQDASASRNCFEISTSGSAAQIGFLNATPVVQQTGDIGAALVAFGLMSGTPTAFPRGYIDGFTLSWASTTGFSVNGGSARDETDVLAMSFTTAISKTTSSWAAGTGNGSLDTGTIANGWYHVFVIATAGAATVDVLISTSLTPTMPATYVYRRRIGSIYRSGGNLVKWFQYQDDFVWDVPVQDVNAANPGTSAVTRTLTVPTGVKVKALMFVSCVANTGATNSPGSIYISSLDVSDGMNNALGPYGSIAVYSAAAAEVLGGGQVMCWTNTSGQVRSRLQISPGTNTILGINTIGWTDPRGRNA